jgi:Domain of unknown function (DUF4340)
VTWRGTILFLVAGITAATLLLYTLRTRTRPADEPLLGIIPAETTSIEITGNGSSSLLERREGDWWIIQPLLDRADPGKVAKLLGAAADIVPLDKLRPSDLKGALTLEAMDLRPVKRSLTFRGGGSHSLRLGSEGATPDRLYAQIDSDPSVYLVSSETAAMAFLPLDELRSPSAFPFRPDQVCGLVLRRQGGFHELILTKKGRHWLIDSPLHARAEGKAVENWIAAVFASRIQRWMPAGTDPASCGLDSPEATLTLREEGGEPSLLELGFPVAGSPGCRYARASGRPGLFVLGGSDPLLSVTPSTLRLHHPLPLELDAVDRIMISRGGQTVTLTRKPRCDDWICGNRVIPEASLEGWNSKLHNVTASSFETATPDQLSRRGIDPSTPPTFVIRFVAHLSENSAEEAAGDISLQEFTVGADSVDGMMALREGKADELMIVPSANLIPLLDEAVGWSAPLQSASPAPTASAP